MTSSYQDPHDEIVLMVIWTPNTPISLVYGIQFTSLLKIFLEVSHHTIAIEIVRCAERVLKGTLKLCDPFLPEKRTMSPKLPITGKKKISLMVCS